MIRALGFILMSVGLWIGLMVINEAWSLYQQPQNTERLARATEKGSNLDKALTSTSVTGIPTSAPGTAASAERAREVNATLGFRLSYFMA